MSIDPSNPGSEPPTVAYAVRDPRTTDFDHLRALSICHYVWGSLLALLACFGLLYVVLGILIATNAFHTNASTTMPSAAEDRMLGTIFAIMGSLMTLVGWAIAGCTIASGRSLARHRRRMFTIVIAAINCAIFPIGTVLGVFTLMVVLRDSVRQLYEDAAVAHSSSGRSTST